MNVAVLLTALGAMLVPAFLARFDSRFEAACVVRLNRTAAVTGVGLLFLGLIASSLPTILRTFELFAFASVCERVFVHIVGEPPVGVLALAATAWLGFSGLAGMAVAARRRRRARVDASLGVHLPWGDIDLVLLPTTVKAAFSMSGRHRQIVVTEGLWRSLEPEQKQVLLAHERAHVRLDHGRDLILIHGIRSAIGWLPGVTRGLTFWRESLERSADAVAARTTTPHAVRTTLRAVSLRHPVGTTGFDEVASLAGRLTYLDRAEVPKRWPAVTAWLSLGSMAAVAIGATSQWLLHAHEAAIHIGHCPIG